MKKGAFVIFSLIFLFLSSSHADSNLFYPYVNIPVGSWPEAVTIGDVNGDGRSDVVMTTSSYSDPDNDYRIFVFLQNSSGGLNLPIKLPAGNGESVDVGDVNNDGRDDVVVTAADSIGVFYQNNSGTLDSMITYPSTHTSFSNTYKVKIADLNNDGRFDVVCIDWGTQSQAVEIFHQNQNGTLDSPVTYTVLHGGYDDLDVGDINNDGRTDIIVMSGQGYEYNNIGILLQNQNGTFADPVYYDLGENELTRGVAVGDVNGDSLQDIIVTYGGNSPNSKIGIFLQNAGGTLNPAVSFESYDIPEPVVIADVNNDARKDILVAHGGWMALGVYLQGSDGALMPEELYPISYASHYNPQGLAVGDINGDGFNDIVIADYNNGLVVLYNIETPCTVPSITSQPQSRVIFSGQAVTLSVTASGTGPLTYHPLTYQWYRGQSGDTSTPVGTNSNSYTTLALTQTTSYWVRISNDCGYSHSSGAIITVNGIYITSPNGGESLPSGMTQTIRWDYTGNPGAYLKIELLKGGVLNKVITSLARTSTRSFNWRLPATLTPGADYSIRITSRTNSAFTDTSDSNFTIAAPTVTLVSPNGGENWVPGTTQTIRWAYTGGPGAYLKIELLKGGILNRTITYLALTNRGSYSWKIPALQVSGADYSIRITSRTNLSWTDTSDLDFTIGP
jgi:hypothetical protein